MLSCPLTPGASAHCLTFLFLPLGPPTHSYLPPWHHFLKQVSTSLQACMCGPGHCLYSTVTLWYTRLHAAQSPFNAGMGTAPRARGAEWRDDFVSGPQLKIWLTSTLWSGQWPACRLASNRAAAAILGQTFQQQPAKEDKTEKPWRNERGGEKVGARRSREQLHRDQPQLEARC